MYRIRKNVRVLRTVPVQVLYMTECKAVPVQYLGTVRTFTSTSTGTYFTCFNRPASGGCGHN